MAWPMLCWHLDIENRRSDFLDSQLQLKTTSRSLRFLDVGSQQAKDKCLLRVILRITFRTRKMPSMRLVMSGRGVILPSEAIQSTIRFDILPPLI